MSSPNRRSSPRRAKNLGERTKLTLPPKGSIPLNEQGYEDLDAFWDAAKSPHPSTGTTPSQESAEKRAQEQRAEEKRAARQRKLDELERANAQIVAEPPTFPHRPEGDVLKAKYGIATPKQIPGWSNAQLHKAMGIPTADGDSPGTVLSKASTAPPSAKSVAQVQIGEEEGNDPPEGQERGLDPEESYTHDQVAFSKDDEVDAKSSLNAKSSSSETTPDMEHSMEEMVERYDDEFDVKDSGGFQLHTEENEGFENDFGGFDEEEEDQEPLATQASQKSGSSKSDDDVQEEEQQVIVKKPRGRPKKDKKSPITTPTSVLRTKKSKSKKPQPKSVNWSTPNGTAGYPTANREYELHPVSEYKQRYDEGEEPKTPGGTELRRSRRARFKPLLFWKNERLIYGAQNETGVLGEAMGDMPVVTDVHRALPTPHKERPKKETKKEEPKKKRRRRDEDHAEDEEEDGGPRARIPFDSSQLLRKYGDKLSNGEHGTVWSEALEDTAENLKVVSRLDNRSFSKLPLSTTRGKKESKVVGFASQAFHVPTDQDDLFPGYIAGNVVLPPRGIKDAEGVGLCSQVFNVGDCQPNSVEFALADPASQDGEFDPKTAQRFLLSKGDMFQIPPGNVYRIENHSRTDEARLFWTIIKCTSRAEQDSDEE